MHIIKKLLSRLYSNNDTICIACTPRSGSTWLAERLVAIGKLDWVDEPLRLLKGKSDPLYTRGLRARTCLVDSDASRIASVTSIMEEVLLGRIGYLHLYSRLHRRLLLKFVRINRMLAWATKEFGLQHNILMLRHPCAVVASQLTMHGSTSIWSKLTEPAPDIPKYLQEVVASLSNGDLHRIIAINWALDQRIPLYDDRPDNTLLVFYEDLVVNPDGELRKICDFCGIKYRNLEDKASATAAPDFSREKQTSKWKEQLSPEVIDDIISTCHQLGVDIYTSDTMPSKRPW